MEYNCALITVDWLAACIELRVIGAVPVFVIFFRHWRTICTVPQQGPIPEEMSQTLLTNEKEGNFDYLHATNIKPTQTRINREEFSLFTL